MIEQRLKELLEEPVFERLRDWYSIGPVQRATLEEFAERIVLECATAVLEVPTYTKDYRKQIEEATIVDCSQAVLDRFGLDNND